MKQIRSLKLVSLISDAAMIGFQTLNARSGIVESDRLRAENDLRFAVSENETTKTTLDQVEIALGKDAGLVARRTVLFGTDTSLQAGLTAAEGLRDTIVEMAAIALQAKATNIDQEARDDLITRFETLRERLAGQVSFGEVNGLNFIDENPPNFVIKDTQGDKIRIASEDLSAQGLGISHVSVTLTSEATASATLLATALTTFDSRLKTLQTTADKVSSALDTAKTVTGHIPNGVAELIDPEITLQNAELRAIDIRQRLGATALAIANVDGFALVGVVRNGMQSISQSFSDGNKA
ncbi:MAG: hypothetical protein HOE62_12835 [Alphaproteobacteria bacterium]|nr:hypothetical protein [Alphaproteobacteria bacterium]MBT5918907.1 hypothetical protein [Alphaproteobacteria bacterium]